MSALIRLLFPLVGYLCVATVITAGAGYFYLRHTGAIDDDRMFQIVSIIHGIDLEQIADQTEPAHQEVPPEELSYDEQVQFLQVETLHLQAMQDDLKTMHNDFQSLLRQLSINNDRIQNFQDEVEKYLEQRKQEALDSGLAAVRGQWKTLIPEKQTKELLKRMIEEKRTDVVILLLNGLPSKQRTNILRTLKNDDDLDILYKIQKQMLAGHPEKTFIDETIKELEEAKQRDNILR